MDHHRRILTAHAVWQEIGGHGARFMVEQFRQHGLDAERLARFEKRGSGYTKAVPDPPQHYNRIMGGESLAIGGREWRVMVGHGHSPEHAALYRRELGVLISETCFCLPDFHQYQRFAVTPDADALGWFLASPT